MVNDANLSPEKLAEIEKKLEDIQQRQRSYAEQRAEGLIDADMHRQLISDLNNRKNELIASKQGHSSSNGHSANGTSTDASNSKNEDSPTPESQEKTEVAQLEEKPVASEMDVEEKQAPTTEPITEEKKSDNSGISDPYKFSREAIVPVSKTDNVTEPAYLNRVLDSKDIVVDIRDITKTYKMGTFDLHVLKGVTLTVSRGEFISIMGPSGSGKSTLMNILGALDQATSGEYFLDGTDVSKLDDQELARVRNKKIGFVFQSFNLLKRTSALRQVELPLIYGNVHDRSRKAKQALEAVGLGNRIDHTPAELSGGQQQRVAIARAIVNEPSIILADEPTGNLDSRSGTEVMQIFQRMNREDNITTIFVTHDPWIARHTDRVIMLRDGKIIADQRVKNPLIAGESERPSEAEELQELFEDTYYGGDQEEYN